MNKPLGVLLITATSLMALATTTAPAKAVDNYSGWGTCANYPYYGSYFCTNYNSTSYVNDLWFTCGASFLGNGYGYTEGYKGPNFASAGSSWNYDVSSFCADYTGPNSGPQTGATAWAVCPYNVAALYGGLHVHC
jgi:hypothetical protein